ncbi:lysozyme family protein [Mesobacillus foraminis]|uniref:lysozyme family protein n=1 Tax=Mesobacillus foraminis TaxID=279826 RepID=UPI000EF52014|nr:lysozyme family protein [Mesobacillus foraminis]
MKGKQKKKQVQRNFNMAILLLFLCFAGAIGNKFIGLQHQVTTEPAHKTNPSDEIQQYTPLLYSELEKVDLEDYTAVLVAIMQQESNGKGGDPMQASESAGLAPNSISDPEQSIKQGVKHFKRTLAYGNQKQVDFPTIIQAYNMGAGYIDYVAKHGGKHSETIAKNFSMIQVKKNPSVYNCNGDKNNFRYPYCYGDFSYTTKVTKNMETLTVTLPGVNGEETAESSL